MATSTASGKTMWTIPLLVVAVMIIYGVIWLYPLIGIPLPPRIAETIRAFQKPPEVPMEILNMTWKEEFATIIDHEAEEFDVDPQLLRAVIQVESNGDPDAYRHEPHVKHLDGPDASWGLMQILFTTAIDLGFRGNRRDLCHPLTNIHYGAKYLRKQIDRYGGNILKAVAAYNAGSARYTISGEEFVNQSYVDKVTDAMGGE